MAESGTGPRIPLSRERVLVAAVELADRDGIDGLSMRRLAQQLGVEAMTLYHHVANKDQLIEGMVAHGDGGDRPSPGRWSLEAGPATHGHLRAPVLDRHGWASALMMASGLTPERLAYMESILGCLRAGGFSPYETAPRVSRPRVPHRRLLAVDDRAEPARRTGRARRRTCWPQVPAEQFPAFVEHIGEHLREPRDTDVGAFEYGLELLLDGFERMLEGRTRTA